MQFSWHLKNFNIENFWENLKAHENASTHFKSFLKTGCEFSIFHPIQKSSHARRFEWTSGELERKSMTNPRWKLFTISPPSTWFVHLSLLLYRRIAEVSRCSETINGKSMSTRLNLNHSQCSVYGIYPFFVPFPWHLLLIYGKRRFASILLYFKLKGTQIIELFRGTIECFRFPLTVKHLKTL